MHNNNIEVYIFEIDAIGINISGHLVPLASELTVSTTIPGKCRSIPSTFS